MIDLSIFSSETALTWFAMDYSEEGEGHVEKLAVKFKMIETKDEFKKAFEAAQEDLKNGGGPAQSPAKAGNTTVASNVVVERARLEKVLQAN